MPQCAYGGQRKSLGSQFSPSTFFEAKSHLFLRCCMFQLALNCRWFSCVCLPSCHVISGATGMYYSIWLLRWVQGSELNLQGVQQVFLSIKPSSQPRHHSFQRKLYYILLINCVRTLYMCTHLHHAHMLSLLPHHCDDWCYLSTWQDLESCERQASGHTFEGFVYIKWDEAGKPTPMWAAPSCGRRFLSAS